MQSPFEWFNAIRTFCILLSSYSLISPFIIPILPLNMLEEPKKTELDIKSEKNRMWRIWKEVYQKRKQKINNNFKKNLDKKYKKYYFSDEIVRYNLRNRTIYRINQSTEN